MATEYRNKELADLVFADMKRRIRTALRLEATEILDDAINEATDEAARRFSKAYKEGEIVRVEYSREEVRDLLFGAMWRSTEAVDA